MIWNCHQRSTFIVAFLCILNTEYALGQYAYVIINKLVNDLRPINVSVSYFDDLRECALYCASVNVCQGFTFNKDEYACAIYSIVHTNPNSAGMLESKGTIYYVISSYAGGKYEPLKH